MENLRDFTFEVFAGFNLTVTGLVAILNNKNFTKWCLLERMKDFHKSGFKFKGEFQVTEKAEKNCKIFGIFFLS